MKITCPHCGHEGEDGSETLAHTETDDQFYVHSQPMVRHNFYTDTQKLFGCPKCSKTFIGGFNG